MKSKTGSRVLILSMMTTSLLIVASTAFADEAAKTAPAKESAAESGNPAASLPVPKLVDSEEDPASPSGPGIESFSAVVNVIRRIDRTEVVFRNGESYYLPSGSKYNEIYAACEESERTGKAIPVVVNSRSRTILSAGAGGSGKKGRTK